MPQPGSSSDVAAFDVYKVDLRAGELYKSGRKIKLQEQPFQALIMLLARPGQVVTREELQQRLWSADTFVDFEHSLNTAIKKLRQALGDNKKKPRFIETLPKRGYRFIGAVKQAAKLDGGGESGSVSAKKGTGKTAAPPANDAFAGATDTRGESSWVGRVAKLATDGKVSFVLVSTDEQAAEERAKLDAANDDVGLSLLIASQKLLMVPSGTPVRILELQQALARCQVRILEGEHYGKSALVPVSFLMLSAESN